MASTLEENNESVRPVNPRRRKRSKARIIKEVYLPVIISGVALLLIVVFIIGSIVRTVQKNKINKEASINASISQATEQARLAEECQSLIIQSEKLAQGYDYAGAIALLDSFSGNPSDYPQLASQRDTYIHAQSEMVAWEDPNQVMNLSFQLLIADPARAYKNETYGSSFKNNFITTEEFSRILQQLYENGYILVRLEDIVTAETGEDGSVVYTPKTLYLPNGKKPVMLTQTNVNYNLYLVDSDGDMVPDQNGCGFASRLIQDGTGHFTNEMVDTSGQTVTGAYDLVPILDDFVEQHPDFSYRGAKAILALTGYNGLFGYRTHPAAREKLGEDAYNAAALEAGELISALREDGYTMAFYTYENISYGESGVTEIQQDIKAWNEEVVPILGSTDILVYAQNSDITTEKDYSGEKYEALKNAGFHYYLGFCNQGKQSLIAADGYVRQGRLLVGGLNMSEHKDWFAPYFDVSTVLDPARNPQQNAA